MAKKRNSTALVAFGKRVEAIRNATGKSYRAAQKQASAEKKGKGKARRVVHHKRKSRPRKTAKAKRVIRTRSVTTTKRIGRVGSVKNHIAKAKKGIAEQLGIAEMKRIASTTRKSFHHQTKKVKELRSQLRRLC